MKKIFSILAVSGLLFLSGCNVLDLAPIDYSAAGNYWKNEAQIEMFFNGMMSQFRGDYSSPFVLGETRGGTLKAGASIEGVSLSYANMVTNMLDKDNTGISNWNGYYSRILQVNHYIEQVRDYCEFLTDSQRNAYLAPAYGLRAYYYFMLYRTYGGVPLETEAKVINGESDIESLYMARSTAEETLQFIKDEIANSERCYGSNQVVDKYKWNYFATEMLKAHVYMWSAKVTTNDNAGAHNATGASDVNTAKSALQNVIGSNKFALAANFADLYDYNKKAGNEVILALYFNNTEATNAASQFYYQASIWVNSFYDEDGNQLGDPLDLKGGGMHRDEYKESFVKSFDKADSRRSVTFHECYSSANPATRVFGSAMLKYMGHVEGSVRYLDSDVMIYRYADALLLMAEAENFLGNYAAAAGYINQIRQRAYRGENPPMFATSDFATTELAILHERDKEFVAEGCRWFDVVRMHDASHKPLVFSASAAYPSTLGGTATPILSSSEQQKLLWPVNTTVLAGDPELVQTYGY
ncbi:MAG: RagB/SusD family nutrient uptake outer membrane protein [Bacteroidales bacterium]|nr:RagB/SusD family nutrient uptake outer membrane protein [Bacteroidales bacterium]